MDFAGEVEATGDHREALRRAHETIGRAIWIATSIIIAGFSILVLSSFFPMVWFGLFTALRVMYELRHQGFVGWIDDLSRPDQLIDLGFTLDLIFIQISHFNLLPLLMVGLWLYLQMGTPLPTDPQQRQMMVMMRFMPIMMGVMLYNYASGLMVYMCTSSLWGIVEQKITKKVLGPPPQSDGMTPTMPMM